jgi:hypothetical protein
LHHPNLTLGPHRSSFPSAVLSHFYAGAYTRAPVHSDTCAMFPWSSVSKPSSRGRSTYSPMALIRPGRVVNGGQNPRKSGEGVRRPLGQDRTPPKIEIRGWTVSSSCHNM